MTREDVREAVRLWNADYVHDRVSADRFEAIVFNDRYYDEEAALVAVEDDRIAGFVSCVAPLTAEGPMRPFGYVKGLCARSYEPGGNADVLLEAAEKLAAARGKEAIKVVEYAGGGYFFPGIDLRYVDKIEFFLGHGYERTGEIQDVEADLTDFALDPRQREARERAAATGIQIIPYDASMLDMMRGLVAAIDMPFWFPEGWEEGYKRERHTFVAIKGDAVLGYANYRPDPERGDFGTTAVLPELRGRGIGSCLLAASMLAMKESGTPKVVAGWANTTFYLKNGWTISRRYATFRKPVG